MRFGVFLPAGRFPEQSDGRALARSMEAVRCAESAGFDDAWIAEHHFVPYGVCPSAITFAAHALGMTHRIALGTAVTVLSTAHPVAVAEQALLAHEMSGGRLHLGVGRGGPWVDLEVFGTGVERYERGFPESLDLLLRGLNDERLSADGEHFSFREVPTVPRPSRAGPPVTVACTSPTTVREAAVRGLPMLLGMHLGDDEKAGMVAQHAEISAAAGHDPDSVRHVSAVVGHVADDRAQAVSELRSTMPGWLAEGLAAHMPVDERPRPARDPVAYTELLCELHPVGSPDDCVDRIRSSAERTGVEHVIMMVEGAGTAHRTADNIARLGAEVLPRLRG